ncbi:hypothetical protein ACHAPU_000814 [Fusarium lateritium]
MPEVDEPKAYKTMADIFGPKSIEELETAGNWTYFAWSLEGGPHGSIHASLGGEVNPTTSPNDRLWWMWQQQQNSSRLSEYTGNAWKYPAKDLEEVSMDDVLGMGGIDE